jgi:hypothetical protein
MLATPVSPPWRTPSSLRPLGRQVDRVKLNQEFLIDIAKQVLAEEI